jgi:hypothetical protein
MFNDMMQKVQKLDLLFQSGNQVPIEKAMIRCEDWNDLKHALESLWEPDKECWEGLARDIVMWTAVYTGPNRTGRKLYAHLRSVGQRIPNWMKLEVKDADFVPPKAAIAIIIYRAMLIGAEEHPSAPGYEGDSTES